MTLPKHDRLREELLNLRVELRPTGALRVFDRGRVHQDHAVAVGGVVQLLVAARRIQTVSTWCYRCGVQHYVSGHLDARPCSDSGEYVYAVGDLRLVGDHYADKPSADVSLIMGHGVSEDRY